MAKTHKLKNIHVKKDSMTLDVDFGRMERNLNKAQYMLDSAIMDSMIPFMPMSAGGGGFIGVTKGQSAALAGSGQVVAAASPYGRFLYEGKTMVDEKTGSPYARQNAKKVLVSQFGGKTNAKEYLNFSAHGNTQATAHWFDAAKDKDIDEWVEIVERQIGKE